MRDYSKLLVEAINEAADPTYYQETFYFTILISMSKELGGSRDETKNDIRALPEVLTVTLVEPEKGGVQRDLGSKYLSTLKVHSRLPKGAAKEVMMKRLVLLVGNLRGISVLRYKERKPTPRRKAFRGSYKITEGDYQALMRRTRSRYATNKKHLIGSGPQTFGGAPFETQASTKRGNVSPVGFGGSMEEGHLDEDVLITIGQEHSDLLAFDVQSSLNPKIWDTDPDAVRPGIKAALLSIVDEFLEGLDLDLNIKDIVVTGSIANYNWSKFSDIDVHILVDFGEVNENEEMVKKFFDAVRGNWNKLHNILVKGHEVEIYVQNEEEAHVSTGVYSLLKDDWIVRPTKIKPEIDSKTALKKMKFLAREIDKLGGLYNMGKHKEAFNMAERLKEKIKLMRRAGLDSVGIYSPENLAFKMLRRSGDIAELFSIYTQAYDQVHSVHQ